MGPLCHSVAQGAQFSCNLEQRERGTRWQQVGLHVLLESSACNQSDTDRQEPSRSLQHSWEMSPSLLSPSHVGLFSALLTLALLPQDLCTCCPHSIETFSLSSSPAELSSFQTSPPFDYSKCPCDKASQLPATSALKTSHGYTLPFLQEYLIVSLFPHWTGRSATAEAGQDFIHHYVLST